MEEEMSTSLESMLEYIRLHSTLSVEDFLVERREAAVREAAEYEALAQPTKNRQNTQIGGLGDLAWSAPHGYPRQAAFEAD